MFLSKILLLQKHLYSNMLDYTNAAMLWFSCIIFQILQYHSVFEENLCQGAVSQMISHIRCI